MADPDAASASEGAALDAWLNAVNGRRAVASDSSGAARPDASAPGPGADALGSAELEGRLLRAAMLAMALRAAAADQANPAPASAKEKNWDEVRARGPAWWGCAGCARRWAALRHLFARQEGARTALSWTTLASSVAGVALVALLGSMYWPLRAPEPPTQPESVLRGPVAGQTLRVHSNAPQAARNQLAGRLAAAGARVASYEQLGRPGLRIDAPGQLPQAVQAELRALGASTLGSEALNIEFELKAAP